MTVFAVDLDQLADVLHDVTVCDESLASLLTELDRVVARLHLSWTGLAADGQSGAQARWRAGFVQMQDALAGLRDAGRRAHATYSSAAEANVRMWSGS